MVSSISELKRYKYFTSLSDSSFETLAQNFIPETFPKAAEIVREGDKVESFYFVKQGRLEVVKNTECGEAKLSVIGSGQGFGEMPLLANSMWSMWPVSIRALTDVSVYKLPQEYFHAILELEPVFKNVLLKQAEDMSLYYKIKTLQPFVLLEPDRMYALLARMTEKIYSLGEDITVQGEKADYYYIVKSGSVAVLKKSKGEQTFKQVAVLSEGDGFGEEALIRNEPRRATCRAIQDTVVYTLDNIDFDQILKSSFLDYIYSEDISVESYMEKYVVIDARVSPEYEQEHIEGARSIPLEVLRKRYTELDPQKYYITYCTGDSRGMVAAFFLKSRGFNAKCLRGGLGGWEGPVASGPEKFVERRSNRDRRSGEDRRKSS